MSTPNSLTQKSNSNNSKNLNHTYQILQYELLKYKKKLNLQNAKTKN